MLEAVQKIFDQNIELISLADKAILFLREEEYEEALSYVAEAADRINFVADAIIHNKDYFELVSSESIMEMLQGILAAKKNKDYVLLADLFELQLVNFLCGVQELIMKKEDFLAFNELDYLRNIMLLQEKLLDAEKEKADISEEERRTKEEEITCKLEQALNPSELLEQGYCVEFTTCGLMTLAAKDSNDVKFYMHTNHKVSEEAFLLARHWKCQNAKKYIIYGYGMGYHIQELLRLAPEADFEIYESDMNILKLSCAFSRVTAIEEANNVKIIYDEKFTHLKKRIEALKADERLCIHYPSLRNIKDEKAKEMLKDCIPWARRVEAC